MAMYYCGLDLHAKSSTYCIVTKKGRIVAEGEVKSTRTGFEELLGESGETRLRIVLEASTRSRWAAGELESLGAEVVVVDPRKVRVIAETKHKTDRTDARILADLLRTDALPKGLWRAPEATKQPRDQVRLRAGLVAQRTALMGRARSLVAGYGVRLGARALTRAETWDALKRRKGLPAHTKVLLDVLHQAVDALTEAIERVEKEYASLLARRPARNMMTIPGVGPVVTMTTIAAVGDTKRFRDARQAAAYTGMVPTERSSGERQRRGHMTKAGPSELRRVWIQAAQAALRMREHPLHAWANKLIYRRGRAVAIVALARRMFRWAFAILRDGTTFNPRLATCVR
jgi:transposase